MALFQPNPHPTVKELRWFAGLWFPAFFGAVGVFALRHSSLTAALAVWGVTAILALRGLWVPRTIEPVYRLLMAVSFPIGWLLSHVIVAAAFYLVITPIGFLMRLSHDPMRRKLERSAKSYWIDSEPADRDRYFRQM